MDMLLRQLEMLQLGQVDCSGNNSSSAAHTPSTATSAFSSGYQNMMQVEIDDLDESPALPYDADEAMTE
eukprot:CAMPEP_0170472066 /NCGR_PEP_ID=MMETSP0123-20130129/14166_1 /TAXON_ID=182087 /ORGANISM="Favella ehrenbergii, Strain Fehren 1" /LENGTH=68 /DNA_ID=CAMNT_0010740103 /DNA_START=149 /DNA_END=355 /DNA_ORIENTATION=-